VIWVIRYEGSSLLVESFELYLKFIYLAFILGDCALILDVRKDFYFRKNKDGRDKRI
jgi:hypothetical protein